MAVVCALQPIPNQGAHTREDLFSIAFGSAANLNIHLHCLVLDGVYRRGTEGEPVFGCARANRGRAAGRVAQDHHPPGAGQRTRTDQLRRTGSAQAQEPLVRRDRVAGDDALAQA